MKAADPLRGEIVLDLAGDSYLLRYDMRATRAILRALKIKNLSQLVSKVGELSADEQFAIICEGLRSGDVPDDTDEWLEKNVPGNMLQAMAARVAIFLNQDMFEEFKAAKAKLGIRDDEDPTRPSA